MKKVLRFIIEFVLAILITALVLVYLAETTILSKEYVISSLEKSNYYDKIYEILNSNFENYTQQAGLEDENLENIVSKNKVKEDTNTILNNIYSGANEEISTDEIKENLQKVIKDATNGRNLSTTEKQSVDEYIDEICSEYKTTISNFRYEKQINEQYTKIMKYVSPAKKTLSIGIIIFIVILVFVNRDEKNKIVTNFSIPLLSSGILLIGINVYLKSQIDINNISILNDAISEVVRNIANDILGQISKCGIGLTIVSIILLFVTNFVYNFKEMEYNKEDKKGY